MKLLWRLPARFRPSRGARVLPAILLLGLAVLGFCVGYRTRIQTPPAGQAPPRPAVGAGFPGGEGVLLEVFDREGERVWRLSLKTAAMAADGAVDAAGADAEYAAVRPPARLAADSVYYAPGTHTLSFRGRIGVTAAGFHLACEDLIFDTRTREFRVRGDYVLTRDGTVMRGTGLWASGDFGTMRATGRVRVITP